MKKHILILLLVAQFGWAQNFENANALYRKGEYAAAVNAYEQILTTKKHSAELYFNLANSYYKMNKVGPSVYYYEKALLLDPNDKEILTNLGFAQKLQIDDIKQVPAVGFSKMVQDVTGAYSADTWGKIAIAFGFIFLALFVGYYFSGTAVYKRIYFIAMFVALIAIAISILSAMYEISAYEQDRPAIVFADVAAVKTEPDAGAQDAFILHEGTKVYVVENLDSWVRIVLQDNSSGWIAGSALKEIK